MTVQDYKKHFKKELPLFCAVCGLGIPAALLKQSNKKIVPIVDKVLQD